MSKQALILWVQIDCILTGFVGLVAAAGSYAPTQEPWRLLFDLLSWPVDGHPTALLADTAAVSAVVGGVMVGWAFLMFFVATGPIARGDRGMVDAVLVSVLGWFLVDSAGSLAARLPGNVVLNLGFLLAFVVPLCLLRGRIRPDPPNPVVSGAHLPS